ncbi:CYTH domain-containing protein [Bizionia sediminis]|uniref:CYTH domain-containing protein n=1 Tax=Bizionia sediminis TaxID=1737064 RepID=A0ABW5KSR6_9FLAO
MIEIERKFLVHSQQFKTDATSKTRIKQGFLNTDKARTVRIRLQDTNGFITVKGASSDNGLSRFEWEKEISKSDAEALLALCEVGVIDKIRHRVAVGNHVFEVDEFFGENAGLIVAEVELSHPNETFEKPKWLGKEVTGDVRYYNSQLSKQPYTTW